jgi:PAS domain S-box-containing protein
LYAIHSYQRRCFLRFTWRLSLRTEERRFAWQIAGYVVSRSRFLSICFQGNPATAGASVRLDSVDVHHSLGNDEFVPYFQPLVVLRTGQLAGFEVLARWKHPELGMIGPDEFIPLAERDGWIDELTSQILREALASAHLIPAPLTVAMNVSPLQLRDLTLPRRIAEALETAGFPAERLVIEITESALVHNLERASVIAHELKAMGCKLALDDFGTGYSSLCNLQSMPFDTLKVDRSFVASMTELRQSRKIVAAVVGLGQSLDLTTVAEGIETQEQAEMLLWLGCEIGQGYMYGKPAPAEQIAAMVAAARDRIVIHESSPWKTVSDDHLDGLPAHRLAHLQAVYDGAPVGLGFIDRNLRYVNLNRRLADMNGASVEEHVGTPVAEMVPALFPMVEPLLRRALEGEVISEIEVTVPHPGTEPDETRLVSYQPAIDEGGEVVGVSLAVIDITERKHALEALRESEAHYRHMMEMNPQILWIMDPDGRNLDVSPQWEHVTGLMKAHAMNYGWLSSLHPDDMQPTADSVASMMHRGVPIDVEYRIKHHSGGWRWMRSRGTPRLDATGKIVCWYGSVEDIDDRKRLITVLPPLVGQFQPAA